MLKNIIKILFIAIFVSWFMNTFATIDHQEENYKSYMISWILQWFEEIDIPNEYILTDESYSENASSSLYMMKVNFLEDFTTDHLLKWYIKKWDPIFFLFFKDKEKGTMPYSINNLKIWDTLLLTLWSPMGGWSLLGEDMINPIALWYSKDFIEWLKKSSNTPYILYWDAIYISMGSKIVCEDWQIHLVPIYPSDEIPYLVFASQSQQSDDVFDIEKSKKIVFSLLNNSNICSEQQISFIQKDIIERKIISKKEVILYSFIWVICIVLLLWYMRKKRTIQKYK